MWDKEQLCSYGVDALLASGADEAQFSLIESEKHELNLDAQRLSLLRTAHDTQATLVAIKNARKGTSRINQVKRDAMDKAAIDCVDIAQAALPDAAHALAPAQPQASFSRGGELPERDQMLFRLQEFMKTVAQRYPKVLLRQAFLDFTHTRGCLVNSHGVNFRTRKGVYRLTVTFSAQDGDDVSSFNYTSVAMPDLDNELIVCGSLERLLKQSQEQIRTTPVAGKFVGDVIIAPDCLGEVIGFLARSISDGAMIAGTSIYKDRLNEAVADAQLCLHSCPRSEEICDGYFLTGDGYAAKDSTIVERGVLKSYLLSLYGARKTGRQRSGNDGRSWVVDGGSFSLDSMIQSVDRGVLLSRFSGDSPTPSGDFSGVAKNSYLIKDGVVAQPLSESMIAGNLADMLMNITAISQERVNFGYGMAPWVKVSGVTVSGR